MGEITVLLQRAIEGDAQARGQVYSLVYDELTRLARQTLSKEATVSQIDAHGLVHEAYVRLAGRSDLAFENRRAFFGYSARVMRSVVLDMLRDKLADKRGGGVKAITLDSAIEDASGDAADLFSIDTALKSLAELDERSHDIFEMHFFAGLSVEEIGSVTALSRATVNRELRKARAWITAALGGATAG